MFISRCYNKIKTNSYAHTSYHYYHRQLEPTDCTYVSLIVVKLLIKIVLLLLLTVSLCNFCTILV